MQRPAIPARSNLTVRPRRLRAERRLPIATHYPQNVFTLLKYLAREFLLIVSTSSSETALPRLIASLADYVDSFQREFSSAVAEERYVQLIRPLRGSPTGPADEERS